MKERTYKILILIWLLCVAVGITTAIVAWRFTSNINLLIGGLITVFIGYFGYLVTDMIDDKVAMRKRSEYNARPKYKLSSVDYNSRLLTVGDDNIHSLGLVKWSDNLKSALILIEYDNHTYEYQVVDEPVLFYEED